MSTVSRFLDELRRRKVIATAGVYLVGAFVTMQVVDAVFQYLPFADPDSAGRLVLTILAIGFPVALGLAWFLEVTPPQLKRERRREEVLAPRDPAPAVEPKNLRPDSVAVLPFENLSDDAENAYFSDGITEDIIASVAHIRGLRVLSRTSVMRYKGVNRAAGEIAAELGVATLVTGSVRRSGTRIRVLAQVVDARTDSELWTETYDRDLEDIFRVQSELASRIGEAVQRELSPADKRRIELRGTTDAEAYDLYLRARFLWNQRAETPVAESVRYFQLALERDPGFALAHAGLADAYTVLGIYSARPPGEVMESARSAAATALRIDPTLAEALASQACVAALYDWDWSEAEAGFRKAIDLAPSYPTARQWYAMHVLTPHGRFDAAREELERAGELDPGSAAIALSRGLVTFFSRDLERATRELQAVAKQHPRFALAHCFLGQCFELQGDLEQAVGQLRLAADLAEDSSEMLAALAHAEASAGRNGAAETILRRLEARAARRYVSPVQVAQVLAGLGRQDEALDQLDEALATRATDLIWIGVRPVYDGLRDQHRFRSIVERLGLAAVRPDQPGRT